MWPFTSKKLEHEFDVPSKPPFPIGEVRAAHISQVPGPVCLEGPFPIFDSTGRFLCKSCGDPFDKWNLASALGSLRQSLQDPQHDFGMFIVNCRKCSHYNFFSPKDVLTRKPGDPLGPWTKLEIGAAQLALNSMLGITPAHILAIGPARVARLLFMYR